MLQIFLVERIPAYEFPADLVTRLCCPTTLRFFRQNSVNAGSTVAPLGAEENLLAEFRKGSPLPSCSGLWGSREETSAARYIPFLKLSCGCFYFSGVSSRWCSPRLSKEARTRQRCFPLYTSASCWWWISVLWNLMPTFFISGGTAESGVWERWALRHRALPSRTRGGPPAAQQGGAPTYVWRRPAAHGRPH